MTTLFLSLDSINAALGMLAKTKQRQQQIPFGDDNKNGNNKNGNSRTATAGRQQLDGNSWAATAALARLVMGAMSSFG